MVLKVNGGQDGHSVGRKLSEFGNQRIAQFGRARNVDGRVLGLQAVVADDVEGVLGSVGHSAHLVRIGNHQAPVFNEGDVYDLLVGVNVKLWTLRLSGFLHKLL